MYHDMRKYNEQGIALLLTLLILSGIISIALGVSNIILSELRLGRTAGHLVPAFFAADSGIEKVLTNRDAPANISGSLLNGATFNVTVTAAGPDCSAASFCIESTGVFGTTRRAIEVNY